MDGFRWFFDFDVMVFILILNSPRIMITQPMEPPPEKKGIRLKNPQPSSKKSNRSIKASAVRIKTVKK